MARTKIAIELPFEFRFIAIKLKDAESVAPEIDKWGKAMLDKDTPTSLVAAPLLVAVPFVLNGQGNIANLIVDGADGAQLPSLDGLAILSAAA